MKEEYTTNGITPQLGDRIVVFISYMDNEGNITEEEQYFGLVHSVNDSEIVIKHPDTGSEISLPPQFGSYEEAKESEYSLKPSGETVRDVKYTTGWTLRA